MSAEDRRFERIGGRTVYEGRIVTLAIDRFRFADGDEVEREIVRHQGAAGIVAHDDTHLYLVRQPREALGDPDFLEIPAGRLDQEGESPLEAAHRELAEEIGKAAEHWEHLHSFYTSAGFADEEIHLYLATGLHDAEAEPPDEDERIEIVPHPLADLEAAIAATRDAKTLVGLLELRARRLAGA
jgi:8-oxo-dGTP pyrophosphatase MutT (NUDIX family)